MMGTWSPKTSREKKQTY